jgi:hypothetical protein
MQPLPCTEFNFIRHISQYPTVRYAVHHVDLAMDKVNSCEEATDPIWQGVTYTQEEDYIHTMTINGSLQNQNGITPFTYATYTSQNRTHSSGIRGVHIQPSKLFMVAFTCRRHAFKNEPPYSISDLRRRHSLRLSPLSVAKYS